MGGLPFTSDSGTDHAENALFAFPIRAPSIDLFPTVGDLQTSSTTITIVGTYGHAGDQTTYIAGNIDAGTASLGLALTYRATG